MPEIAAELWSVARTVEKTEFVNWEGRGVDVLQDGRGRIAPRRLSSWRWSVPSILNLLKVGSMFVVRNRIRLLPE